MLRRPARTRRRAHMAVVVVVSSGSVGSLGSNPAPPRSICVTAASSATHHVCFQLCRTGQLRRVVRIKWARARELSGTGQAVAAVLSFGSCLVAQRVVCKGEQGRGAKGPGLRVLRYLHSLPKPSRLDFFSECVSRRRSRSRLSHCARQLYVACN